MTCNPIFRRAAPLPAALLLLAACSSPPAPPEPLPATRVTQVFAVTEAHELIQFAPQAPQRVLARTPISGLAAGETLLGIDFRVARGVLYALASSGQLYTLHTVSGRLTPVGVAPAALRPQAGQPLGFDFNPTVDRIRVVDAQGRNWRLHPDTGAAVDGDPAQAGTQADSPLRWREGQAGTNTNTPRLAAAAYSYNKTNDKLTTNYAIDLQAGALVMQGSREGSQPAVSPNTGWVSTVGALGTGALEDASLDIADIDNTPLAALRSNGRTHLYWVDLASGRARNVGAVADGGRLRGLAIEP